LNFIGKICDASIVQRIHLHKDLPPSYSNYFFKGAIVADKTDTDCFTGFDARISKLIELGGACYVEAAKSTDTFVSSTMWTLLQYFPFTPRPVEKPSVAKDSILLETSKVIGTAFSIVRGSSPDANIIPGNPMNYDFTKQMTNFNASNKGYLFSAKFSLLAGFMEFPLACYSNCGAILLFSGSSERIAFSHAANFVRELGVPVFITTDERVYEKVRQCSNNGLLMYANEFKQEGLISTDVPSQPKQEKRPFLSRIFGR